MNAQIKIAYKKKEDGVECYRLIDSQNSVDVGFFQLFGKGKSKEWGFVPMLNYVIREAEAGFIIDRIQELSMYGEMEDKIYKLHDSGEIWI